MKKDWTQVTFAVNRDLSWEASGSLPYGSSARGCQFPKKDTRSMSSLEFPRCARQTGAKCPEKLCRSAHRKYLGISHTNSGSLSGHRGKHSAQVSQPFLLGKYAFSGTASSRNRDRVQEICRSGFPIKEID
jgi:hypothetical protein